VKLEIGKYYYWKGHRIYRESGTKTLAWIALVKNITNGLVIVEWPFDAQKISPEATTWSEDASSLFAPLSTEEVVLLRLIGK
jgi:hypothetical protein